MLFNSTYILSDIERHLLLKMPFSIIRGGDGNLKLINLCLNEKHVKEDNQKLKQQGIPKSFLNEYCIRFVNSCNKSNYISSFKVYLDKVTFYPRKSSTGTLELMKNWKQIYKKIGITNTNYCSPELPFLLFLKNEKNLFDILKDRKICIINNFKNTKEILQEKLKQKIHIINIPGEYENHYSLFNKTLKEIKEINSKIDIFLIGAGELGKLYCGEIKELGKISIDIGNTFTSWSKENYIESRARGYIIMNKDLTFSFTEKAINYMKERCNIIGF